MAHDLHQRRASALEKISSFRRLVLRHLRWERIAILCAILVIVFVSTLGVDWFLRLNLGTRIAIAVVTLAVLFGSAIRYWLRNRSRNLADMDLATVIDRHEPGVAERLASVIELPEHLAKDKSISPALATAAAIESADFLDRIDFSKLLNSRRHRNFVLLLIAALAIPVAAVAAAPDTVKLWANRWIFGSDVRWPQKSYLGVIGLTEDGRIIAPRGEPFVLQVRNKPIALGENFLPERNDRIPNKGIDLAKLQAPERVDLVVRQQGFPTIRNVMNRQADGNFRFEFNTIIDPLKVMVLGGDDWLGPFEIAPVDRPSVAKVEIRATPPGRPEREAQTFSDTESSLSFLPNTTLRVRVSGSVPLSDAKLVATTGNAPALQRIDETTYTAEWKMKQALTLEISLTDKITKLASKPYFVTIGLLEDRPPRILSRTTGIGRRVTPSATIPNILQASDDFGMTKMSLDYELSVPVADKATVKPGSVAIPLPKRDPKEPPIKQIERQSDLSLKQMNMPPGATIKLRGSATDNRIDGPQTASSRWLALQIVTPEELFYELLMKQRAQRAKFTEVLKSARTIAETIAKPQKEIQASVVLRSHQILSRDVLQVANRLEASLIEMKLNELGSSQAYELMETKVITPMRKLHAEPMSRFREKMEQLSNPTAASAFLDDARKLQAENIRTMEKILEQMSQWESFVDVVNQLREVIRLQDKNLDATEKLKKEKLKDIFDQ